MPNDLTERIKQAASEPASASEDGSSMRQHDLADLLNADKYLTTKEAAAKGRLLRFQRIRFPGASA